jgi:hypothetical protein
MTGPGDWVIPANNVTVPTFSGPNDSAIVLGPDVPPCMQARYYGAMFFRPPGTVTNTIDRPTKYIGLVRNLISGQVDEGFCLWDQKSPATICGFYAYKTTLASLAPAGSGNSVPQEYYGDIAQGGSATMTQGGSTNFGSVLGSPPTLPWAVNIGTTGTSPTLSPFTFDGVSAPRGPRLLVAGSPVLTSSGAGTSTGGETAAFSAWSSGIIGNSMVFQPGRMYKVTMTCAAFNNGGNTSYVARLKSTLSTTTLGAVTSTIPDNGHLDEVDTQEFFIHNATGSPITTGFKVTMQRSACTTAGATCTLDSCLIDIEDYGATSGFGILGFSSQVA